METQSLNVWILQTGEPLPIDSAHVRPMRAMNLCNALVQAGHRVVLWSSAFYHQEKRHRSATEQRIIISDALEIRLISSRGYRRHVGLGRLVDHAQMACRLGKMLRDERDVPDAAFVGYPPIETAAVMTRWLARHGVPCMLDVKDQWPTLFLDAVPMPFKPFGRRILRPYFLLAKRAMRDATGISSMSAGFLDWALAFAGRGRTVWDGVFPLTSPAGQIAASQLADARRWWDEWGVSADGRPRICFVGSHSSAFDFLPVREAARKFADENISCEFILCGEGDHSEKLRSMMNGLSNVKFPGWIDRPCIEALAERCRAALAPYENTDGFQRSVPNKIIDALSIGLPILSPLRGELADIITTHHVGLRYGTDTQKSLYDCILTLIYDTDLQERLSANARSLYRDQFSFEKVYGRLVRHLENMAGENRMTMKECYR